MEGMWNYFPALFDDFALLYICNENNDGTRSMEEGVIVYKDEREPLWLGRPEHEHVFHYAAPYKCQLKEAVVRFPHAPNGPLELRGTPLLQTYLTAGTGYGLEADWRHGMYQGKLEVQAFTWSTEADDDKMWGLLESPACFTLHGGEKALEGRGMLEFAFFSEFDQYTKK
jgi:hypothetical protein